jgi:hypothetical protein
MSAGAGVAQPDTAAAASAATVSTLLVILEVRFIFSHSASRNRTHAAFR